MTERIKIKITPNGALLETDGFRGPACEDKLREICSKLGLTIIRSDPKPEQFDVGIASEVVQ